MKLTDLWANERQQLTNACDALYEAGLALLEFAHDNGPLGDPDVRVACLRALSAGEVARGAGLLAAQAVELLPKPTVTDEWLAAGGYANADEWAADTTGMRTCVHCGTSISRDDDGDWQHDEECPKDSACWSGMKGATPADEDDDTENTEHTDTDGVCCECGSLNHICQDCPTFGGPGR